MQAKIIPKNAELQLLIIILGIRGKNINRFNFDFLKRGINKVVIVIMFKIPLNFLTSA